MSLKIVFISTNSADQDEMFVKVPAGDKNILKLHLSCRMNDLQFSLVLQTHSHLSFI